MYAPLRSYIQATWAALRRSPFDAAYDPKVPDTVFRLYVPESENIEEIEEKIKLRRKVLEGMRSIVVQRLPPPNEKVEAHGILYLPNDYIVPGGRFNEMYAWDSYWIVRGLIRDGYFELAKGIAQNCFYQIAHYGSKVLNGNRTYYDRSQPPVLAHMVVEIVQFLEGRERSDFLVEAERALSDNYFKYWQRLRFTQDTGLFHYGSPAQGKLGPCPEVVFGERDPVSQQSHYDKIIAFLKALPRDDERRQKFYDPETDSLTEYAIAGDRGMRESGFDPTMHLGYYGFETHMHNPVCLNSLLFMHCEIAAGICHELGYHEREIQWRVEIDRLRKAIREKLWNSKMGMYMAFNFEKGQHSDYPFLSAAYPLLAGIADQAEARNFRTILLDVFETDYGLMATPRRDGCQWELMWAPFVDIVANGLRRYGYDSDAARIEKKFVDTVNRVFESHHTVYEKYDPDTGTSSTAAVAVGYEENVKGFGWTNGLAAEIIDRIGVGQEQCVVIPA